MRRAAGLLLAALAAGVLAACTSSGVRTAEPLPAVDACDERLHVICGLLLRSYAENKRLPAALDELSAVAGPDEAPPLVCPVSQEPYAYDPAGLEVPGLPGRLVLYDSRPVHNGQRWGAFMLAPAPGRPVVFQVLPLSEDMLRSARPAALSGR